MRINRTTARIVETTLPKRFTGGYGHAAYRIHMHAHTLWATVAEAWWIHRYRAYPTGGESDKLGCDLRWLTRWLNGKGCV